MQLLKKIKYIILSSLFFVGACNNNNSSYPEANNALDAGREFIDATLKGDFAKAYFYLLQDAENKQLLAKTETDYRTKDRDGREQFRQASINIGEIKDLNKNETIVKYSNSFDKVKHQLKIVLQNNKWRVDFKYTFK